MQVPSANTDALDRSQVEGSLEGSQRSDASQPQPQLIPHACTAGRIVRRIVRRIALLQIGSLDDGRAMPEQPPEMRAPMQQSAQIRSDPLRGWHPERAGHMACPCLTPWSLPGHPGGGARQPPNPQR